MSMWEAIAEVGLSLKDFKLLGVYAISIDRKLDN